MFSRRIQSLFGRRGESPAPAPPIAPERLIELMRCFPIGGRIRYYPEHRKDIVLESIIIAYGIDSHLVYSQHDIHLDADNGTLVFLIDDNWKDRTVREVYRFCALIPYAGAMEGDLDYDRRAALDAGGFLQRGERLTLMSLSNTRGVPHVNTQVRKRVLLKEGYYANHAVVVLEMEHDTLNHVDQRQQMRVRTCIPVSVQSAEGAPAQPGTLVDFTESALKIKLGDGIELQERKGLIVTIHVPERHRTFVLAGKVLRRDAECVVLALTAQLKDNRFRDVEVLDALDLKATLLQHPATRT